MNISRKQLLLLECVNVGNSVELSIFAHLKRANTSRDTLSLRPGFQAYGLIKFSAGLLALKLQIEIQVHNLLASGAPRGVSKMDKLIDSHVKLLNVKI